MCFVNWLLSLSKVHLSFLHLFSWLNSSFLFSTEKYSIVLMYYSPFIHSPSEGHLGCFQDLAIMNKAAVSVHMQVFVWIWFSTSLSK